MLIYLICVGAVLQGDGNWLYDHWGDDTELHSAVLIETSGLVFTIIFSVSICVCVCMCVCLCLCVYCVYNYVCICV